MSYSKVLWKGMQPRFTGHCWKLGMACAGLFGWIALRQHMLEPVGSAAAFLLLSAIMYQAYVLAVMGGMLLSLPPEVRRKTAHLLGGGMLLLATLLTGTTGVVVALCVLLLAWLLATRTLSSLKIFRQLSVNRRDGSESWGDLWFPVGMGVTVFWFGAASPEWCAAALVLTVSDAAAALVGTRMRRLRFHIGVTSKSLGGSVACLLTATASIGAVGLLADASWSWSACLGFAALLTVVEAVCVRGVDNLALPLLAATGLTALNQLEPSMWLLVGGLSGASLTVLAVWQGVNQPRPIV